MNHTIVWRRIDKPGHEYSRLSELEGGGAKLGGVAVFSNDDTPHCIEYEILCDPNWRTLRCRIAEHSGGKRTDHDIRHEGNVWTASGQPVAIARLALLPAVRLELGAQRGELRLGS